MKRARATSWDLRRAIALIRRIGVVLEGARGPVPSLAEEIAGEPIRGSWWGHPRGHEIFALTRAIRRHRDILVCRLVGGKITYVHRRLWPAVVRMADEFPRERLAQVHEVHTPSGRHHVKVVPFPKWASSEVLSEASGMDRALAAKKLGPWCA